MKPQARWKFKNIRGVGGPYLNRSLNVSTIIWTFGESNLGSVFPAFIGAHRGKTEFRACSRS